MLIFIQRMCEKQEGKGSWRVCTRAGGKNVRSLSARKHFQDPVSGVLGVGSRLLAALVAVQALKAFAIPGFWGWVLLSYSGGAILALLTTLVFAARGIYYGRIGNLHLSEIFAYTTLIPAFFGIIFWVGGVVTAPGAAAIHDGSAAMYMSFLTWTTVGYGDYTPAKIVRSAAVVEATLGYVYMGMIDTLLITVMTKNLQENPALAMRWRQWLIEKGWFRKRESMFWAGISEMLARKSGLSRQAWRAILVVLFLGTAGGVTLLYLALWAIVPREEKST